MFDYFKFLWYYTIANPGKKTEDTMRKFFAFLFGPGTALLYGFLGVVTFWSQLHWSLTDKVWLFVLTIGGIGFIASQLFQVILLRGTTLGGGVVDILFFIFNLLIGAFAVAGLWGASGDWMEHTIYLGFIALDIIILVITLKVYKLTSEFSSVGN